MIWHCPPLSNKVGRKVMKQIHDMPQERENYPQKRTREDTQRNRDAGIIRNENSSVSEQKGHWLTLYCCRAEKFTNSRFLSGRKHDAQNLIQLWNNERNFSKKKEEDDSARIHTNSLPRELLPLFLLNKNQYARHLKKNHEKLSRTRIVLTIFKEVK